MSVQSPLKLIIAHAGASLHKELFISIDIGQSHHAVKELNNLKRVEYMEKKIKIKIKIKIN